MSSLFSTAARSALLPVVSTGPLAPVLVPLVAVALIVDALRD